MSLLWKVDDLELKGDRLRIRGWCHEPRRAVARVEVVFAEPRVAVALASYGLPSPDVAASVEPAAAHCRFDEELPLPPGLVQTRCRLQAVLADGTISLAAADVPAAAAAAAARPAPAPSELERVIRREAEFRLSMVKEFLDRGERNTYLHSLRREQAALKAEVQAARRDVEVLVRRLEAETARGAVLEAELAHARASLGWRLLAPFRRAAPRPAAPGGGAPGAAFVYFLHTSPFRVYRESSFTLRGWAWPEDGRAVTAVRVNLDGQLHPGRHGLEEPEAAARHGAPPANPRPGFEVAFPTPAGRHELGLEAQLDGAEWRTILRTAIWSEAPGA